MPVIDGVRDSVDVADGVSVEVKLCVEVIVADGDNAWLELDVALTDNDGVKEDVLEEDVD